jgi:hypothetical protein
MLQCVYDRNDAERMPQNANAPDCGGRAGHSPFCRGEPGSARLAGSRMLETVAELGYVLSSAPQNAQHDTSIRRSLAVSQIIYSVLKDDSEVGCDVT